MELGSGDHVRDDCHRPDRARPGAEAGAAPHSDLGDIGRLHRHPPRADWWQCAGRRRIGLNHGWNDLRAVDLDDAGTRLGWRERTDGSTGSRSASDAATGRSVAVDASDPDADNHTDTHPNVNTDSVADTDAHSNTISHADTDSPA
jgi:hypothetical protein